MLRNSVLHFLKKGHKLLFLFSRGRDKVSPRMSEDVSVGRWEIFQKVLTHFFLYDSAISFDMNESSRLTFLCYLSVSPKTWSVGMVTPASCSLSRLSNSSLWFWVLETNPATRTQNLYTSMIGWVKGRVFYHLLKFCIEFPHLLQDAQVGSKRGSLGEREYSIIRSTGICFFPLNKVQTHKFVM